LLVYFSPYFRFVWSARAAKYYANETSGSDRQRIRIFGQRGRHQHGPSNVSCQQLLCASDVGEGVVGHCCCCFSGGLHEVISRRHHPPKATHYPLFGPVLTFARVTKLNRCPANVSAAGEKFLKPKQLGK